MTDLSCLRIRHVDGTPLDLRQVWAVIQEMEQVQSDLLAACKRLLECLEEDETYEVMCIATLAACDAIAKAEGRANG